MTSISAAFVDDSGPAIEPAADVEEDLAHSEIGLEALAEEVELLVEALAEELMAKLGIDEERLKEAPAGDECEVFPA